MSNVYVTTSDTDSTVKIVTIDRPNESANVLSASVLKDLANTLDILKTDPICTRVIFRSIKSSGFILGADVTEFDSTKTRKEIIEFVSGNHAILARIRDLPMPTVAVIDGQALGGGLELALYCDKIIASNSKSTKLGLPEVNLGILPGYGGMFNCINRMGDIKAMTFILGGRPMPSRAALKQGLIDGMVIPSALLRAAQSIDIASTRAKGRVLPKLARKALAPMFRKNVAKKVRKEHYPAPYRIIDHWVKYGNDPNIDKDSVAIQELFATDAAAGLLRCFALQNILKKLPSEHNMEYAKSRNIHVVGAGVMGADIASWCAIKGLNVTLHDINTDVLGRAIKRTHKTMDKIRMPEAKDRLVMDVTGDGARRADIIIEAVLENLEIKTKVLTHLEEIKQGYCVLATNTSSICIEDLQKSMKHPEKLMGLHFFNPVAQMQLVEIVKPDNYNSGIYDRLIAFTKDIGKLPLPVKSHPGFLVNRVLLPYMCRAVELVEMGYPVKTVDAAALSFGMPMGPLKLGDTVGLDICLNVSSIFEEQLGADYPVPELLKEFVADGNLGVKSGRGFYGHKKGTTGYATSFENHQMSEAELAEDLKSVFVEECALVLEEGIVESKDHLDAGTIFATGFCPFTGGPSRYL
jgi:3-hydroxyacyl-CoA dehydrogenase/enoyl-CoA hydratase/3-hydroxybutyryl-CoA epimerase